MGKDAQVTYQHSFQEKILTKWGLIKQLHTLLKSSKDSII